MSKIVIVCQANTPASGWGLILTFFNTSITLLVMVYKLLVAKS